MSALRARPKTGCFAVALIGESTSVDAAQERRVRNETLFREVNERVEELAVGLAGQGEPDEFLNGFVCECGREDCVGLVQVTHSQYEAVRSDPRRFIVLPGHEDVAVERVVERRSRSWVVEKFGEASEIATEHDPRS
jgi:hypothetical protein